MKTAGYIFGAAVLLLLFYIIILSLYKGDSKQKEIISKSSEKQLTPIDTIHIISWNIGYAGLGEKMDFFYDGGEQVRSTKEHMHENMKQIISFLQSQNKTDIYLLQEVDKKSKRSHYFNQFNTLNKRFSEYYTAFGINYKTWHVPFPLKKPLGIINSGLMTLSRYSPSKVIRHKLPGKYAWPKCLFMPQRCMLINHYTLKNGKKLIVVNTHLSAFDKGSLKNQEMKYIQKYALSMYKKGHFIIIGGDWNQTPPHFQSNFSKYLNEKDVQQIPENVFSDEWQWVADPHTPTNRSLKTPFDKRHTKTSVLDFFMISPNVEAIQIKTIDLKFKHSDHQPVVASFKIAGFD